MKKINILSLLAFTLLYNCALPFADKQFFDVDLNLTNAARITQEFTGDATIILIPTGDSPSISESIKNMKMRYGCKSLKNIDAEFFHNYYYIVGFPKLILRADCIK